MAFDEELNIQSWKNAGLARPKFRPDDEPVDTTSKILTATVIGQSPRWTAPDLSAAIWGAVMEMDMGNGETEERAVTIKGDLARVTPGEMLSCKGRWTKSDAHGWSFAVTDFRSALPKSAKGVSDWLANKIDGVGPTFAKAIVAHFGYDQVYDILDADPTRLREVKTAKGRSLPEKQVEKAIEAWAGAKAIRQIETFLFSHGVSANLAGKLYRKYGSEVIEILKKNPYRVIEMRGIGFKIADQVAVSMGTALDSPFRIMASILFVLEEAEGQGHTFLHLQQMVGHAIDALTPKGYSAPPEEVRDPQKIAAAAGRLFGLKRIIVEDTDDGQQRVYSMRMWKMETRLARHIRGLMEETSGTLIPPQIQPLPPEGATEEEIAALKLPSAAQWSVIDMIRLHRMALLTGGPGVGKTASTNNLVEILRKHGKNVKLAAPTGKAARRMQELTGHPASTIHRLLEFNPFEGGFQRHEENPIEADVLIVDETSMLSLDLADSMMRAVGPHTHVLYVGDPDQLAPVGAGKVLDDLIKTEKVPRVHLGKVFRQAAQSMIIQNARRINRGKEPYMRKEDAEMDLQQPMLNDFFWITRKTPAETAELVLQLTCEKLPRAFDLNPVKDIMVLVPMRDGQVGLHYLNSELEKRLNTDSMGRPKKAIISRKHKVGQNDIFENICVGSRIVQTKNDYTEGRQVMNGELAIVTDYNENDKECRLSLDDGERSIWVPVQDMDTYFLAWALTTHKSQGSEFKCVVIPVSTVHFKMLNRALYYTAVTRARELCVMVGEKRAMAIAVKNPDMKKRNSTLMNRILDASLSGELF